MSAMLLFGAHFRCAVCRGHTLMNMLPAKYIRSGLLNINISVASAFLFITLMSLSVVVVEPNKIIRYRIDFLSYTFKRSIII